MAAVYVATAARAAACVSATPEAGMAAANANGNNTCSCMGYTECLALRNKMLGFTGGPSSFTLPARDAIGNGIPDVWGRRILQVSARASM